MGLPQSWIVLSGRNLQQWALPTFWNFNPEQVQNSEKLIKYLKKVCRHPGNPTETQITAMCWGLMMPTKSCSTLLITLKRRRFHADDKVIGPTVTSVPVWLLKPLWHTLQFIQQTSENKSVPVTVTSIYKTKKKLAVNISSLLRKETATKMRMEDEMGMKNWRSKRKTNNEAITVWPPNMDELQDIWKHFNCHSNKHTVT